MRANCVRCENKMTRDSSCKYCYYLYSDSVIWYANGLRNIDYYCHIFEYDILYNYIERCLIDREII